MATCIRCGAKAGFMMRMCGPCIRGEEELEAKARADNASKEAQLDGPPQKTGSQTRAVIFLLLAGPASCGLTTVPDNPSRFALIVFAAAWLAVILTLLEKYKPARVITVIIFCISLIPFFITLGNLWSLQAVHSAAPLQNVLLGSSLLLLTRGGATLGFCGLALWSLPKPVR